MTPEITTALARDRVVDITTAGRHTGEPRRIEIWFFRVESDLYLTGAPGRPRSWYANLVAAPDFTLHLKQSHHADLAAHAVPITGDADRKRLFRAILEQIDGNVPDAWMPSMPADTRRQAVASMRAMGDDREGQLPQWLAASPLVRIEIAAG